ncbi:type 1 fimbrial protein [Salmonella enterica]|nr:type 1 fimbrial protein [Salmonella enterica subsp. enterica serovar Minnesota]EGO7252381.1 type 1 fimbrial protein [Salmonella enterica]
MSKFRGYMAPGVLYLVLVHSHGVLAAGNGLDVKFSGTLIDRVCTFVQGDQPLEVEFPSRALKYFEHHSRTTVKAFDIVLKDCSSATLAKTVEMTFSSARTVVVNGQTFLEPEGGTGLVIGLQDGNGTPVEPGTAFNLGSIRTIGSGSENRFTLGAYAMAPAGKTIMAGPYKAVTTFTLNYL